MFRIIHLSMSVVLFLAALSLGCSPRLESNPGDEAGLPDSMVEEFIEADTFSAVPGAGVFDWVDPHRAEFYPTPVRRSAERKDSTLRREIDIPIQLLLEVIP